MEYLGKILAWEHCVTFEYQLFVPKVGNFKCLVGNKRMHSLLLLKYTKLNPDAKNSSNCEMLTIDSGCVQ